MIAVADILVQLRISRHGRPVGRRDKIVTRIVIERRPVSENEGLALNARDEGKIVARIGKIRRTPRLQTHLAKSLTNRNLSDLIGMDPETPVHPRFTRGVIRLR